VSARTTAPRLYPLAAGYRRPAALDEPAELHQRSVLSWLEPEPLAVATNSRSRPVRAHRRGNAASVARYAVVQAYVVEVTGRFTWVAEPLARGVTPLAGVQLVDGLRALRTTQEDRS
jgi:hypothetical protein